MKVEGFFFDRHGFSEELQKYQFASSAIVRINESYMMLDNGEFTPELLQKVLHSIDQVEEEYVSKQVSLAGKSPLVKEAVAKIAADRFEGFSMSVSRLTPNQQMSLNSVDFSLINHRGEFEEEKLREKHTYEAKTERQKEFIALVQRIHTDLETLKGYLPEGFPIVGDNNCFYVELDGSLQYNPEAIKVVG